MRTALKALLILVVLGAAAMFGGYQYWQQRLGAEITLDQPMLYEVSPGDGFNRVVSELEQQGVLADAWAFKLLTRIEPDRVPSLKVGEYLLEPGMSGMQVLDKLASADVVTYSVTIPEGWTFQQMRDALDGAEKLAHLTTDMSSDDLMAELGREGDHPEGRFFPDTYTYHKGVSDLEILRQAMKQMDDLLAGAWAERDDDLPLATPYEALIMASLIERETGAPEERREIAGVFKRRMERGMRLQTDPTVIYGMGERYEGNITRADLREATPYNTYVIDGLPPTPIALPGRAAIEAAVHPAEGETLYFVAKGDGTHHFSRTLREHNNAVNRYIRGR
ncbi:endolytic transglycosylase MltG [Halomonas denitrificans]|uniref:endolytic transglycosylase MltG n=1 Tax=Halomonas TaxID=2745 RepID=UPI001C938F8A|nr:MULTISPECIES: endolytic transglycosylase MltG [Halomonas]MED5296818.1 endolytic transglycosylase MltG [Pseudomonadota bacterium]MBY5925561.1 endolytic transglycosylase MltG [Halomonas sp. DP4Y7-2]MBY5930543.1 endolytic transglycosylase MltG [Halomonas sp. DP8Y7-3]MBY5969400.1 endolytic transglycosylase MltG [Halomonas denitrificans]MBY5985028.1 endolytic transglycosylase MltG [Halomonas sp. DP5Y7-2]